MSGPDVPATFAGGDGSGDICPRCGSADVVMFVRGLPAPEEFDSPPPGVEFIGCVPIYLDDSGQQADGRCTSCDTLFARPTLDSDDEFDDEDDTIEIPENATQEEIDAIMMDGARPVSDGEMRQFFGWVASGIHGFVRAVDDPRTCFYCGEPESSADHVPAAVSPNSSVDKA